MKKIIVLFFFVLSISNVNADCSYSEKTTLNKLAANVKIDYVTDEKKVDVTNDGYDGGEEGTTFSIYYLGLNVLNLSKELYLEFEEKEKDESFNLYYNDTDNGSYTKAFNDLSYIRNYVIKIYSSSDSSCPNTVLKTVYLKLPKINEYQIYCSDLVDSYLCEPFINVNLKEDEFFKKYENVASEKLNVPIIDDKDDDKNIFIEFLEKYGVYIVVSVVFIGSAIIIYYVRKRKKEEEFGL